MMEKNEALAILLSVCQRMESMTLQELYDRMYDRSESFRTLIEDLKTSCDEEYVYIQEEA